MSIRGAVFLLLCALWLGSLVVATTGQAQRKRRQAAPKVIQLEEIRIEGRVQKPNAFYILNRSSLGYEVVDLSASFLKDVVRAVKRDPF
ncbi:MAG: hypothetical protein MJD61_19675 [Proteobacteria bacterium]|nr:hypothetical protein [Pseudomonadota bacterium]